ncbi:DUF2752 domain-containing protein [Ancylomarina sp. 16SWW S1-10-2]|uniref:DUF2752 domain-containing protein n=1 Tax=Ancylomarina sp. 16SWW S1-10-2 TaxID=2499681 RepID=UPI0012AE3F62|nr:DUF2752 domain-containing protein [Ancylomarina sp. 16SWW S1-10-2]
MWQKLLNWLETHRLSCQFYQQYHIKCPGCGFQSAFISLLKGNFQESIQTYPAILPLCLLAISVGLHFKFKAKWTYKSNQILASLSILFILINFIIKLF